MTRKNQEVVFKVAAAQPNMVAGDPEHNIRTALGLTRKALKAGAQLIVLPELFVTGFAYDCIRKLSQKFTNDCLRELRRLARDGRAVIVAGSVTVKKRAKTPEPDIYNTSYIIGPDGRMKASYSKMHMFSPMDEDVHLKPGTEVAIAKTPFGKIAPCICFDIRFPEVARRTALMGAQILAVPAEFPRPRLDVWQTLLKARAIENQFFVVAANRVGSDSTGDFFGHSAIIGPTGKVLAEAGEDETILIARIDLDEIAAARKAIPCFDRINPAIKRS